VTITVVCSILQTPTRERVVGFRAVLVVGENGRIEAVLDQSDPANEGAIQRALIEADEAIELPETTYLLPGLVDLHVHAPQWPQVGTGLDLPLERWLSEYTFPLEARYDNLEFAQHVWTDLVSTLLAHGTTTAVYYGSVHVDSTTSLARTC
ncbi:uncharacterized protein METZ01_LOCUS478308, partial [marine metagenome]